MEKYLLDFSEPILNHINDLIKRMKVMHESTIFEKFLLLQEMKRVLDRLSEDFPEDFPIDLDYLDDQHKDLVWSMLVIQMYLMYESWYLEDIIKHDLREISYGKNEREYQKQREGIMTDYTFWLFKYNQKLDKLIKCVDELIAQPYIRK